MSESNDHAAMRTRVEEVLELMRPSIQSDGGDVEVVDVSEDGHISVRFHGACVGCPSSGMTLKAGIERNLKTHVPGFKSVEAVDEHGKPISALA
jgi:Fe-S cluster biogenesis protein NfuA